MQTFTKFPKFHCSCYTFRHKMHAPPSSMAFNRLRRGALRSEQTCSLTGAAYYMLAVLVAFFTAAFMVPANKPSFPAAVIMLAVPVACFTAAFMVPANKLSFPVPFS